MTQDEGRTRPCSTSVIRPSSSVIDDSPPKRPNLDGIQLIIFDKDGTLIDFDAMWGAWVTDLARRLESVAQFPITNRLFHMLGFDPVSGRVLADGRLAVTPMAILRGLTVDVLREAGLSSAVAEAATTAAWHEPDPVALAVPLTNLQSLFSALRHHNLKIAIATTDDRASTVATLAGLGVAPLVDALVCADDGVPVKPAPDMVLTLCRTLDVSPSHAAVVGDSTADLQMGRAAGAGLVVGVLSGVSDAPTLEPLADAILPSIADLV
jgi:phosphoglycolate phosphatase-like HAD superfamily hydrolase